MASLAVAYFIASLFIASAWSDEQLNNYGIIGGYKAQRGQFPFQVSIEVKGKHFCGGAIISPTVILTAAHCVSGVPIHEMSVLAGTINRLVGGHRVRVARAKVHEYYSAPDTGYDIALLFLASPLPEGPEIKKAVLPALNEPINLASAQVSGFGVEYHGGSPINELKYANIAFWPHDYCAQNVHSLTPTMICGGDPSGQENACPGDSGGPLSSAGKVIGLVSWGYGCGAPGKPAMYTYVGGLRNWITDNCGI